jgi:hypothetical protein
MLRFRILNGPSGVLSIAGMCLVGLFASANAYGTTIDLSTLLANPSFEGGNVGGTTSGCPIGWICGGSPAPGFTSYAPTSAQYTAGSDGLPSGIVPSGSFVATSPVPVEGSGSLMQTGLGTYIAGNTYTLNLWVGTPKTVPFCNTLSSPSCVANVTPSGPIATITAYFFAAGGQGTGAGSAVNILAPAIGQWQNIGLTYTPSAGDLGKAVGFEIFDNSGANNLIANYDIVAATPEPTSLILIIGAARFRKRRSRQ